MSKLSMQLLKCDEKTTKSRSEQTKRNQKPQTDVKLHNNKYIKVLYCKCHKCHFRSEHDVRWQTVGQKDATCGHKITKWPQRVMKFPQDKSEMDTKSREITSKNCPKTDVITHTKRP